MVILVISLLTILAGTLLLVKFKKDMPGKFFHFIAWFFVVVGFILFIGFIVGGIYRVSHDGFTCKPFHHHEMMMKKGCGMGMKDCCCPCCMDMEKCMGSMKAGCCNMKDSTMMKECPMHMKGDTTKMPVKKE